MKAKPDNESWTKFLWKWSGGELNLFSGSKIGTFQNLISWNRLFLFFQLEQQQTTTTKKYHKCRWTIGSQPLLLSWPTKISSKGSYFLWWVDLGWPGHSLEPTWDWSRLWKIHPTTQPVPGIQEQKEKMCRNDRRVPHVMQHQKFYFVSCYTSLRDRETKMMVWHVFCWRCFPFSWRESPGLVGVSFWGAASLKEQVSDLQVMVPQLDSFDLSCRCP